MELRYNSNGHDDIARNGESELVADFGTAFFYYYSPLLML